MKVYVAGPMRGIPHFNFPAFDAATAQLRRRGHTVFNPAEHDRETHGEDFADGNLNGSEEDASQTHGFNLREALLADLTWIAQNADAIAVLDGWENSKGANAEVALARALGLYVAPVAEFGWAIRA